jgi:hypothetical protein
MGADLPDVSHEAWSAATTRLRSTGVFADEERMFPSSSVLRKTIAQFQKMVQSEGYRGGDLEIDEIDRSREGVDFLIFDRQRHSDIHSAVDAWYSDYVDRWRTRITESVADWIRRLEQLKTTMQTWLPPDMSVVDRPPTPMYEELMRKFKVPMAQMPTFEVRRGTERVMRVQPKGLWIIGANGRVDLITTTASFILVDESEPLSGAPDWQYYTSANKRKLTRLDKARFISLLN